MEEKKIKNNVNYNDLKRVNNISLSECYKKEISETRRFVSDIFKKVNGYR